MIKLTIMVQCKMSEWMDGGQCNIINICISYGGLLYSKNFLFGGPDARGPFAIDRKDDGRTKQLKSCMRDDSEEDVE